MGLLRNRGPEGTRYTMREKMFAIGDDYWIETESGDRALKVDGKALRIRDTLVLESPSGEERFSIEVDGGPDLEAKGNIVDHEYEFKRDGDKVAEVSKRWFRMRDTYGIEVAPDEDNALILACAVCIDQMSRG
jgi:uncharacterized protein YxjI